MHVSLIHLFRNINVNRRGSAQEEEQIFTKLFVNAILKESC